LLLDEFGGNRFEVILYTYDFFGPGFFPEISAPLSRRILGFILADMEGTSHDRLLTFSPTRSGADAEKLFALKTC
jgi:hypothetical protein